MCLKLIIYHITHVSRTRKDVFNSCIFTDRFKNVFPQKIVSSLGYCWLEIGLGSQLNYSFLKVVNIKIISITVKQKT